MARRDQFILVTAVPGGPQQFGVAGIGDNPFAIGTGAGGAGDSGGSNLGTPNLMPITNPNLGNILGTLGGGLTPPTATGGGPLGGITGLTSAKITNVISPPYTAVGTSFPIEVDFINLGPVPGQFRLSMTFAQLGIDQVNTPPIVVHPGQPGRIVQNMGFPVIHPPPGPYIGTVQLVHADSTGASIVDDTAQITLPSPSGADLPPGTGIAGPNGQIIPPTQLGILPGDAIGAIPTPFGPVPAVSPIGLPVVTPGPGTQNAVIIGQPVGPGLPIGILGFNFVPFEHVTIHHRIVLHGNPQIEGHVIDQSQDAIADNTGRLNTHIAMPRLPFGVKGDGIFQATGTSSRKSASTSLGVN